MSKTPSTNIVIAGEKEAVNPAKTGTKAAAHYVLDVPAGGRKVVRLRLSAKDQAMRLRTSTRSSLPVSQRSR